jgi:hypothetical protein
LTAKFFTDLAALYDGQAGKVAVAGKTHISPSNNFIEPAPAVGGAKHKAKEAEKIEKKAAPVATPAAPADKKKKKGNFLNVSTLYSQGS